MSEEQPAPLLVQHMRVIWRDTFVFAPARPTADKSLRHLHERLAALPAFTASGQTERSAQPELLSLTERVSRGVAGIGHPDLLRVQFQPLRITDLDPMLDRLRIKPLDLTPGDVRAAAADADLRAAWITVTPLLVLHRAGVAIMTYHADMRAGAHLSEGFTPDEAITLVRLGISTGLLGLNAAWRSMLPPDPAAWGIGQPVDDAGGEALVVAGLRDLTQGVIAPVLGLPRKPPRRRRRQPAPSIPPRPTGSATVVLARTLPRPGMDFDAFVDEHGPPLRGIGAMDSFYAERAPWIVARELHDNLCSDAEGAVYLLGNSELILLNEDGPAVLESIRSRLRLKDTGDALTYWVMHYVVLLEWVYIQDAILRMYIQRLDTLAANPTPQRRDLIAALQGALADMVQYQENITPYATRVEFLERARRFHKIDELAERFERKQDLLLSYISEYHDYRDARASEFLNWLAGILAGAELANLLVAAFGISPETNRTLFLGVTLGSVLLVFLIMGVILRQARRWGR
ncbi:MAG: hypothetical protein Kow00124_16650 [Anaerolineae bacterium]